MTHDAGGGSPPPKLRLPEGWPGLDGSPDGAAGGPYIEHTRVLQVLKGLREELGSLRGRAPASMSATWSGPGTAGEVQGLTNVGPAEAGPWDAAKYFGLNAEQAHEVLSGKYQLLIDRVEALVTAVERAVANYEKGHKSSSA
ncbi:hypothetical protein [Microbispora sp. NBRC 16548]|uniref:hypothetical protein n=1 Tax=Microbispora sp. NBRC 16548 TaxID=3030994 RepID=UPI001608EC2E|nr:hypothetical protein [Microbispora sp. NBRC 16548]GLX04204.1 hypothetical protein Misp03_11310 [Microbispora sp. NBRC 16548]